MRSSGSSSVYGDGSNVRDWLYVDDHARGLLAAAISGRPGETYCISGRSEMTKASIANPNVRLSNLRYAFSNTSIGLQD